MMNLILMPAYGRRYHTANDAMHDWDNGKDFRIINGPYCSIRDLDALSIRHNRITLHADDGGVVIVNNFEKRINPLDFLL